MLDSKFKEAKNYNFIADLQLNNYVDCKDTVNHWCVGQVCDVDDEKNQVKVHFEGWTNRYDEWIKKNSQRLAPFRRHTDGYTGQKKTAYRDFKVSYPYLKQMQKQVQETILQEFRNFEAPSMLTQYIRGELYFFVDSLISLFTTTTSEDLPAIFEFMQDVFKLIFKWMEIFPTLLKSFNESMQHPQLYLTDMDAAIANCGNELFGILEKCFGRCLRCLKFLQRFGTEYIFEGEKVYANKDRIKNNGLMMSFINAFGNMDGFDKVLNFINFQTKDAKQVIHVLTKFRGKSVKSCPFILTMKILRPFISCLDYLEKNTSTSFAEQIQISLTSRLDNLSENEIKELDKDILRDIIEVMKYYILVTDPANADQIAEIYELRIAQKYLRCPFFEKRVRGINELKEIYYKVRNSMMRGRNNDQYEYTKWLTEEKYASWIINEKIIEFIFLENPHVELIKRSGEILRLLTIDEKYFSPEVIEMIWSCCREKHEDIVRASLDLIQELAIILPLERLGQFFLKLQSIKESEFDEKLVTFLRNYTINTMKNIRLVKKNGDPKQGMVSAIIRGKKEVKIDESRYYDLSKFWLIFQESNKVSQKVKDLALNSLIDILQDCEREQKESFISMALDNIKRGDSFYSSIIFMRKILNTYPLESQMRYKTGSTGPTVTTLLQDIFQKIDLFEMLIINTIYYMKQAHAVLPAKLSKLNQGEKIYTQYFVNYASHDELIRVVMNFIEYILINSKVPLTFDHVSKMFHLFVVDAVTEYETNLFYQLITKENEAAKTKEGRFLLDDRVRNEVFQKIFCNNRYLNSEKINIQGFICFKRLFLIVNEEEKALKVLREDRVVVTNLNQLQGMDTLWLIAIQNENQQVKDICKDFLVDLYLKFETKSAAQKKQVTEIFPQKCLVHFKACHERPDFQLNCLRLIRAFIARFDGEHILEEDISQYDPRELKTITVTLNPDKQQTLIKIHPQQKFWQLKRKMANAFKLKLSELFIKTRQGPLEDSVYDEQIKDYKIDALHVNRVPIEEMEREFPRYIIGYNQDYIGLFLELLKVGQEECKREVLNLLEILPINLEVKFYLRESILKMPATQTNLNEWMQMFTWNEMDLAKSCYFLMSLEELVIPRRDLTNQEAQQQEIQIKHEFCAKFIQSGGFVFLFEIFNQLDKQKLEQDVVKTKVITILVKILTHLLGQKQYAILKQFIKEQQIQTLMSQALVLIESFILTVYQQQANGIPQALERNVRLLRKDNITLMNAFAFVNRALVTNPTLIQVIFGYQQISKIVRTGLIDIEVESIQKILFNFILDISVKLDTNQLVNPKPSYFFMNIFINDCLQLALKAKEPTKTKNFFDLVNEIFNKTEMYKDLGSIRDVPQLTNDLAFIIFDREIIEISARDEDIPLQGIFSFLKSIFLKYPSVREDFQDKNKLLKYLIHDCLFHKETRSQMISKHKAMPPKCKHTNTRDKCLELLNELCSNNTEGMYILIRYLKNYISETFWRTPRKGDWQISVHQQERSLTGYVGLKNIGCICYMNSIMQQLFMIPAFRKSILEVDDPNFGKEPNDENVLYQLKMIFGGLMEIEKQYYNPKKFCSAFKDLDGSPIDPIVQKDVDEFFNQLMDKVDNLTKGKKEEKVIKNLFQGVFANEFICKGCPHYSEREEPFLAINLQVKNKHSIKESLDSFVEGEMLEGDNAYYCEKCEKKVNTLKRCCIKRMPNVMFIVLKRFEFNYDTMTKFKINDYCEFPMSINMSEYSKEQLAKKDLLKEMEEKNLTLEDLNDDQREIMEKNIPSKYYEYNLKGAVIHIGTAEQGHYISISQDRENPNGKWYEFNDDLVKQFDPQDIPYEAFGGDDDSFVNNINILNFQGSNEQMMNAMKQLKTKIKNAYVLIYEREEIIDMESFSEIMDDPQINLNKQEMAYRFEQCKIQKTSSSQIQIPLPIHESILEKNKKFWLSKFIFNKTYIDSILNIFKTVQIEDDQDYLSARSTDLQCKSGTQLEFFKFLSTFFFTTVIRAKERKTVPYFMKMIRQALKQSVSLSVWLLESFSNQDLIKELLIDCPVPDMKRFVAGLLKTAMQTVYKFEEAALAEFNQHLDSGIIEFILNTQEDYIKHHRQIDMRQPTTKGETINTSPLCQNLNLFIMSHHNKSLPILILFINSFIHLGVSQHYFKNQILSGQFYQVFSHFSELGEQARLYLLKTKQVGRMLDIFMNGEGTKTTSQLSEKFRNEIMQIIPLFSLSKELYMESNLEKNDVYLTFAERKQAISSATPPYMFLTRTVSLLSRSCSFVRSTIPNPYALDSLNFILDPDELVMISNHKHDQWWNNSTNKLARNSIADMFANISFDNKEISFQILSTILEGLSRLTFADYKIYERALVKQLMIKDQYQLDRTKKALQALYEVMKGNTQYYKDVDSMIDIVLKLAQRSQHVVDLLNKQSSMYRFIEQWSKEQPHFPLNQSKIKIFRQGTLNWSSMKQSGSVVNQNTIDRTAQYTKERLQKFQALVSKEVPPNENAHDSDDDMYEHQFQEKERLDFRQDSITQHSSDIQDNWFTGSVDIAIDDMVKCVSEQFVQGTQKPVLIWIETESDKLAPPHTQTVNEKRKIHQFYMSLLRNLGSQGNA